MSYVFRFLSSQPALGSWNMALDEALLDGARLGSVTLRFYAWNPPCLSFGRNQVARGRYDPDRARERGIDCVRRPTGGRAVLHDREITYCVTAPDDLWGGLREGYGRINRALGRGLAELGVPLDPGVTRRGRGSKNPPAPPPIARACFRDPLPGELTSGGRKLVGSAQWRADGALLQHGSILLHDDQPVVDELRTQSTGDLPSQSGACSLHALLGRVPPTGRMLEALAAGFGEEFEVSLEPDEPTAGELRAAERLQTRYGDPDWTWRR
jgi:lipoate-protein ligase A